MVPLPGVTTRGLSSEFPGLCFQLPYQTTAVLLVKHDFSLTTSLLKNGHSLQGEVHTSSLASQALSDLAPNSPAATSPYPNP